MIMKDFGVTAICCTPSYFIHLIERAGELGMNMKTCRCAWRVWRRTLVGSMRAYIQENPGSRPLISTALRDRRARRSH